MSPRPGWRTSAKVGSGHDKNFHLLVAKRFPLGHPLNTAKICKAMAKTTGQRCRQPAVKGSELCKVHGGLRWPEKLIAKEGPQVRQRSVRCHGSGAVVGPHLRAALAQHEGIEREMPQRVQKAWPKLRLRARFRLLEAWLNRELNRDGWTLALRELGLD